jgi:hypothetical protein
MTNTLWADSPRTRLDHRVYKAAVVEGFEWVQPLDEADFDAVYQLDGTQVTQRWKPIRVKTLESDDRGRPLRRADLPWLGGHALVFRDRARDAVAELLAGSGEFLELELADDSDRFWLYNARSVADALDEDASDLVRFPSTGRVMKVNRHVFRPDVVADLVAFRVPQTRSLFLAGDVVDGISALRLSGAGFELAWEDRVAEPA